MMSRVRGLSGYLRDRPIWVKLGLIMIVPTIATVAAGFGALLTNIGAATDADRARTLTGLAADSGALVHALQDERAATVMLLASPSNAPATVKGLQDSYKGSFRNTDLAIRTYREHRNALAGLPDTFVTQLQSIDGGLAALSNLRLAVASSSNITLNAALQSYGSLIDSLVSIRASSAQLAGDAALSYEIQAGAALSRDKEWLSQERVVGLQALLMKDLEVSAQQSFIGTLTAQFQALNDFTNIATPTQLALLRQTYTGPDVRETQVFEEDFHLWRPGDPSPTNVASAEDWDNAFVGAASLLRQVEQRVDDQTLRDATALHNRVQSQVLVEAGLLLSLVLVAVLIAWFVARSMNRSLRELRHGALAVAQYGLPQAVARLRDPALSAQMTPQQVALQIADPLPVRSRDEFGQVTEAFNAVHLEAVRTAAEQAALRSSVATMFVNLARRSQILVDRLIGHLDRLERGEEDPDRLAELFQLDHLATRMRRNDENLLVLAGADSTRVQREPAALIDVLRAAQSEVEHYTRIEFGVVDRDIEVASQAVNDLVHLIAELFDNATAFSPPDSSVIVEARRVGDRAVLYVEDHGIGVAPDQLADLNERLAAPPEVDVAVSRMMGLVVVARLAARHGVKVELRPAHERGTIADVLLPTSVLVPRALSGRGAGPATLPASPDAPPARPEPLPSPRAPYDGPLALESGPSASGGPRFGDGADGGAGGALAGAGAGGFGSAGPDTFSGGLAASSGAPAGARQLPAWSDLTGAVNGTNLNGVDVFAPRRPQGGGEPLPQRRAAERRPPEPGQPPQERPAIPRQTPSSPEALRGPDRDAEVEITGPSGHPSGRVPDAVDADVIEDRPSVPGPAGKTPPGGTSPPAWPPAWPPIPAEGQPEEAAPAVPDELAAALDITSEMPRVQQERQDTVPDGNASGWNAPTGPNRPRSDQSGNVPIVPRSYTPPPLVAPAPAASPPPAPMSAAEPKRVIAYADETMELPIFQELESAWFRTRPSSEAGPTGLVPGETPRMTTGEQPVRVPEPAGRNGAAAEATPIEVPPAAEAEPERAAGAVPAGAEARMAMPDQAWRTAADEGWHAAQSAAQPEVSAITDAGLPKRVPMAQLVPGGVDKTPTNANRRSPEQVRGLLSAYHRGVQRARNRNGDDAKPPESSTPTGNSHGGKELE
jgi:signal transduction histidine kinase